MDTCGGSTLGSSRTGNAKERGDADDGEK